MRYRLLADCVLTLDDQQTVYRPGQVTWEDERIVEVGAPSTAPSPVDQEIRVPNGLVLPGLLNGHNHAAMTLMRGYADDSPLEDWLTHHIWPLEAKLNAEDVYWGTLLACAEMIRSGTVGFADMYFFVEEVAQAVDRAGLRAWIARGLVAADDPSLAKLEESVTFALRWRDHPRVVPMLGPHAPYTCPPEYLREVSAAAQRHRLAIHTHLAESAAEVETVRAQYHATPFQVAQDAGVFEVPTLIAHGIHVQPEDLAILSQVQGGIVHCPVSNAKLGNGILPYHTLTAHGVTIGLGTDGPASTNTLDMFQEMKAMAWLQKLREHAPERFRAQDALWAATRGTAQVLGHPGGQLAVGAPADLVVVRQRHPHWVPSWDVVSNLVYAATGSDVEYTIAAGRILMARGVIQTFDEEQVMRQVEQRGWRLKRRVQGE
jgi:5-methylthioadenosine/S-adenosylhomocysteine deaminase